MLLNCRFGHLNLSFFIYIVLNNRFHNLDFEFYFHGLKLKDFYFLFILVILLTICYSRFLIHNFYLLNFQLTNFFYQSHP
jgi:hypothetical protein